MKNPNILNQLDQAVAENNTDLKTVCELVAQAFAWMPFEPQIYFSKEHKAGPGPDKYNAEQLRALRNNPNQLDSALKIKKHLAEKSDALLSAAHDKYGSRVLPRWSDKKLDITGNYWDQVKSRMESQFGDINNESHLEGLAIRLAYGMRLDLDVQFDK